MVFRRKKKRGKKQVSMSDFPPKLGQRYKGETHSIMATTKGVFRAEFCGPGTQVEKRIQLGIKPLNSVDAVCKTHDIAYLSISKSNESREQKERRVRAADIRMIRSLKGSFNPNAVLPRAAINAKIKAEDLGLLSKSRFINPT